MRLFLSLQIAFKVNRIRRVRLKGCGDLHVLPPFATIFRVKREKKPKQITEENPITVEEAGKKKL